MSTATTATPAAGAAAAPASGTTPASTEKKVITPSIAAQIRRRAQGLPELTPEQLAEQKAKADADKLAADAKAAADKKTADDAAVAAALAAGGTPPVVPPVVDKVKKVKAGPALPDAPAAGAQPTVEEQVRAALAKDKETAATASTPALSPEIEREVELARFAAKRFPEKYAEMEKKVIGYYQAAEAQQTEKAKELGGRESAEFRDYLNSEEWTSWKRQNQPNYVRGDVAKLRDEMISDRARAEARAEMAPELKALERKTAELQHAPEIQALTNQALKIIINDPSSAEKDPALAGFSADPIKFGEQYPEEAQLIASEAAQAIDQIKEVYRIDRDLVDFDAAKPTPVQREIRTFAQNLNEKLRTSNPTGLEMQDGKILIDADTYQKRGLARDPRYRTLNAHEIAGAIAAERGDQLRVKLARRRDGVSKSIYAPRTATPPVVPPVQAAPVVEEPASPDAVSTRAGATRGKPLTTAIQAAKNKYLNGK